MTVFEFIDYFASSYCRVTLLLKTKNGLVRTQMTPELAAIALDPNGGYVYIHCTCTPVMCKPLRTIYKIIICVKDC